MSAPLPPPDLRARVLEAARREPARSRAAGVRWRAIALALGFVAPAVFAACIGSPAKGPRPVGYLALVVGAWVGVAVAATWAAASRGRSMLGRPTAQRIAIAAVTPAALVAAALLGNLLWPQTVGGHPGLAKHAFCATLASVMALGPLAAFLVVSRRSDPVAPGIGGAALGAAAGAWGGFGVELFCTCAAPAHVVLGHVLPVVLLALVGAVLGDRALRVVAVRAKNG